MSAAATLQELWYGPGWRTMPLWPLSWLFGLVAAARRGAYRVGLLRSESLPVPVVVVGNLTVGGTGKTPLAAWVAQELGRRGHAAGVVLRGYGGTGSATPRVVQDTDDASEVGDEALLHARRKPHVVVIGADRVAAARLAERHGASVIVCDDGLQHLRLARDCEIAVVDAARGLGNGHLLPAGPLREPAGHLDRVHAVVITHRTSDDHGGRIAPRGPFVADARFEAGAAVNLRTGESRELGTFRGREVHAVAGIGYPQGFFAVLRTAGIQAHEHPLPDHAALTRHSLPFPGGSTVLMTEKDAVKCRSFAEADWWYVELVVRIERETARDLLALILERTGLTGAGVKLG